MLQEFKEFAMKGNVVDLAIGVIIGAAFGKIVESMVADIIMPIIGAVTGGIDFSNLYTGLSKASASLPAGTPYAKAKEVGATLGWGQFLTLVVNFMIIAWVLFMIVKAMNKMKKPAPAADAPPAPPSEEVVLLTQIRDSLKK
ncbi:MAG: large conductance mechanosensitive channel protein MscL [Beijerinckiaceae bacterium]